MHDATETARASALQNAEQEEKRIQAFLDGAARFLDQAHVPSQEEIENELAEIELQDAELVKNLELAEADANSRLGDNRILLLRRSDLVRERAGTSAKISEFGRTLTQLGRLRVQYDRERGQLEFLEESEGIFGSLPVTKCPSCLQEMEAGADNNSEPKGVSNNNCYICHRTIPLKEENVSVKARLRAVRRRIGDLEKYMKEITNERESLERHRDSLNRSVSDIDSSLSRLDQTSILPSMQAVMENSEARGNLDRRRAQLREYQSYRERAQGEGSNLLAVRDRIRRLRHEIQERGASLPPEVIVEQLTAQFNQCLKSIRFPFSADTRIDSRTYRPVVRGQMYGALQSLGAIALTVSAWHFGFMQYALNGESLHPMLLLLDSPLSHVGHSSADPDFRDHGIVEAFYRFLKELHISHQNDFQIILCSNTVPESLEDAGMICVEFTGKRGVGRVGLISDEYPQDV